MRICWPMSLKSTMRWCFVSVFVFVFPFSIFAQYDKLVEKVDPAVFQIIFYNRHGNFSGTGSGFFVSPDGLAYTTGSLVGDQRYAIVKLTDGRSFKLDKITRINEDYDFVEFQVNVGKEKVPFLPISSQAPAKGTPCINLNIVDGVNNSLGIGYVTGYDVEYDGSELIQTSIVGSTSGGGPVLNIKGEVFGIVKKTNKNSTIHYAYPVFRPLEKTDEYKELGSEEIYFFNKEFPNEDKLQLNSVEFIDSTMIFNLSFHNYSFYKRSRSIIWVGVEDSSNTFKLINKKTGKTYFAGYSTLGGSRMDATSMAPGEIVEFKIAFFGVAPEINSFDLIENMPGGDWDMYDLNLPKKGYISEGELQESRKVHRKLVMDAVKNEDYRYANWLYDKYAGMYADDLGWQRLGAFVSMQNDQFRKGIDYSLKVLENGGGNMDDYMKLFQFYKELEVPDSALWAVNKAIELMPSYRECFYNRSEIHVNLEKWSEALKDLEHYFVMAGEDQVDYYFYMRRGFIKAKMGEATACQDFEKAKEEAPDAQAFDFINRFAKPYCSKEVKKEKN